MLMLLGRNFRLRITASISQRYHELRINGYTTCVAFNHFFTVQQVVDNATAFIQTISIGISRRWNVSDQSLMKDLSLAPTMLRTARVIDITDITTFTFLISVITSKDTVIVIEEVKVQKYYH